MLTFTIHKTIDDFYYFRLRNDADKILLTSRNYPYFSDCMNDVCALQLCADMRLCIDPSVNIHRYWVSTCEKEQLARSPHYDSVSILLEDMQAVKSGIITAEVIDCCSRVKFFKQHQ